MSRHSDSLRLILAQGPVTARKIVEKTGLSQPTVSRALAAIGDEIVRIGAGASIQYAIRDNSRGFGRVPVCRVTDAGQIRELGMLIPVRPGGFVMVQADGVTINSDGLPWWMFDMRPQGYLGRAYASTHASTLGLPSNPDAWDDSGVVRALISHGHDAVGNLLVGDLARNRFINSATPPLIVDRASEYPRLAVAAGAGELPGSSAGGEQPKFCAYTERGHVLVKFSAQDDNPVAERWRDLLMAEHLALATLGVGSEVLDVGNQRFLEVSRFDRVGMLGRVGMISLKSLDAEFVGDATAPWPAIVARIAAGDHVVKEAVAGSALLWAFGVLIGNTDMHTGNLSFVSSHGRPYRLAPAYDMLPMGFQPRSGGGLVDTLQPALLTASIDGDTWRDALRLAREFLGLLMSSGRFSPRFAVCIDALERHVMEASGRIARMV
jgi:DNA-binding transcriptional ArsR family regulator